VSTKLPISVLEESYKEVYEKLPWPAPIPLPKYVTLGWMGRVGKVLGQCFIKEKVIEISPLYGDPRLKEELPSLMAHEAAHFLWPNHKRAFKKFLQAVGVLEYYAYGSCRNPTVAYLIVTLEHKPHFKLWQCPGCKAVMASDGIVIDSCGRCDEDWNANFRLQRIHVTDVQSDARYLSKLVPPSKPTIRAGLRQDSDRRSEELAEVETAESLPGAAAA
jgi:hypothetical protein